MESGYCAKHLRQKEAVLSGQPLFLTITNLRFTIYDLLIQIQRRYFIQLRDRVVVDLDVTVFLESGASRS